MVVIGECSVKSPFEQFDETVLSFVSKLHGVGRMRGQLSGDDTQGG
jgi:hypothetical protein